MSHECNDTTKLWALIETHGRMFLLSFARSFDTDYIGWKHQALIMLIMLSRTRVAWTSLWTKRCAAFGHTVWGCYYINFGGKLIYTARLWARILRASEAIWAAILAQMPQNFSHMYLRLLTDTYPDFTNKVQDGQN